MKAPAEDAAPGQNIELVLERSRFRFEVLKWCILVIGAVTSFAVVDYGRLRLEQFRARAENQRELLRSYLAATEAPRPEVWKRKLHVLRNFADDERVQRWAESELKFIDAFSAQDTLYRETLKVASQLVDPAALADPERAESTSVR